MRVGLQTNVFTADVHQNRFAEMFQTIKATGYDGFEIGVQRVDISKPTDFAQMVADAGLETAAIHTHFRYEQPEWVANADRYIQEAAAFTAAVGAPYMPMSGSRMKKNEAQLADMAKMLNHFGTVARAANLRFCYHHHDWEFADNWRELHFLMEETDPDHVGILSDIGWIIKAGESIDAVLATYGERITYFHVKDAPTAERESWFTELGQGIVPIEQMVAKLDQIKPEWLVVERDAPLEDAAESAKTCRNYLRDRFDI